jgi:hypothetical protein
MHGRAERCRSIPPTHRLYQALFGKAGDLIKNKHLLIVS